MLILVSVALVCLAVMLFSLCFAVWLLGLAVRMAMRLFQLGLLIVWAGITVCRWLRQHRSHHSRVKRKALMVVLEGEILPPENTELAARQQLPHIVGNCE